jgi:electron transfer flavoprotein beta subunit
MNTIVCIKQIPNPDALAAVLRIDESANAIVLPPGHPQVVSPFDEQALEAALRIRDRHGAEVKITAVTLGPEPARAALKQALALGADDGVHLCDTRFAGADGYVIAHALSAAIRKLGAVDLVLAGRQAADLMPASGARYRRDPRLTVGSFACGITVNAGAARVERVLQDGLA